VAHDGFIGSLRAYSASAMRALVRQGHRRQVARPTAGRAYGGDHPRMNGLYALKPWYTRRLASILDFAVLHGISPDLFTASGVAAAVVAAVFVALGWWPLASVFLALRLAGANLDGAVARARNVARPWGFVLNEIGDRAADLVVFAGLAVWAARQSGPGLQWLSWPVLSVLAAALAATLPTFASLATCAAGATRRNGGPLGKTERCLAVVVATALPVTIPYLSAVIIVGSVITAAVRVVSARRELGGHD
jgi:CDP-diacylglycerol---glycerol-3-phosphate 3-phosphatidyltransferase